jgi:hypothetical protein
MRLDEQQMRGLCGHLGYGNPKAPLWFVGTEEGLGGKTTKAEDDENIIARCAWSPVMDMFEAHRTLKEGGVPIDISKPRAGHVGVWQWMAKIARAFQGATDFRDTRTANDYIRSENGLGRSHGRTFLTELKPFPTATANAPLPFEPDLDQASVEALLTNRRERQLNLLAEGGNRCVICYGSSSRRRFAEHFGVQWQPLETFAWFSAAGKPRRTTIFHARRNNHAGRTTKLFMLPFLGNGALSQDVLERFVRHEHFQSCRSLARGN